MKNLRVVLGLWLMWGAIGFAQGTYLAKYAFDPNKSYPGLPSNAVTQLAIQGDSLTWIATGGGLSYTRDFGQNYTSLYAAANNLPRGGISAIEVKDSIIWVAGVFDSNTTVGSMQTGGGLAYSKDYGTTWTFVPQPVDSANAYYQVWDGQQVRCLPIVTPVSFTTWDIALTDDYVYIVSWAGGLRRSADWGRTWERVPLPPDDLDQLNCGEPITFEINPRDPPDGNHNHKGFSVIAYGDTIWVGTANGINFGIIERPDCIRWRKYTAQNSPISGNFVVALGRQLSGGRETIWAVTLPAEGAGEYYALSKTQDAGLTWSTTLIGERGYGFAFDDSIVYVATEHGLYKSLDGENWAVYRPAIDEDGDGIFTNQVYTVAIDHREGQTFLWMGTADGIAKTADDGVNWNVMRYAESPVRNGKNTIYAYPNPFIPTRHNVLNGDGHVRIRFHLDSQATVRLEVFDFAMERVYVSEWTSYASSGDYNLVWNGRNSQGDIVANGTYFCKLVQRHNGKETEYWSKLIVLK